MAGSGCEPRRDRKLGNANEKKHWKECVILDVKRVFLPLFDHPCLILFALKKSYRWSNPLSRSGSFFLLRLEGPC